MKAALAMIGGSTAGFIVGFVPDWPPFWGILPMAAVAFGVTWVLLYLLDA